MLKNAIATKAKGTQIQQVIDKMNAIDDIKIIAIGYPNNTIIRPTIINLKM